ncbi:MAG: hypothetical protein M1818_000247 [Claussenomyces sp. TS43310]|nr:MAG: hypothetical protein M1818_000247 [Claussenomyces sp. TS43310]
MAARKDDGSDQIMTDINTVVIKPNIGSAHRMERTHPKISKGHELSTRTIKAPAWSYACLELESDSLSKTTLDELVVRSYLTAALTQFLGLTGSAISVDILKVEEAECWIRVPRQDLSAVIAAVGGWIGGNNKDELFSWRVIGSGDWLGHLVGKKGIEKVWTG